MMAEDQQPEPNPQPGSGTGSLSSLLPAGLQGTETSALQLKIKNSICKSVQSKVDGILQDVEKFTDIEKLYLYLRLPSGPSSCAEKTEQSCLSSSRSQQMHAFGWIRNHLEEHPETSLPKQEVYDEYKSYCDNLGYHALSAADFGKIMKNVFPNMKARRLGMRGKSKYCYSGLRKKAFIHMPSLPSLELHKTGDGCEVFEPIGHCSSGEDEVRSASCGLVCEWAQKVLSRQFDSVEDLARYLLNSHYIGTKSVAALTVMTGSPSGSTMSLQSSAFVPTTDAHSFQPQVKTLASPSIDAKQQLQRKIQKKQQEQKLHSPLPAEAQARRADGGITPGASIGIPCGSPALLSPQPTIGIVVAAVPSPITVQRSRQLMSPSPVPIATAESKVLPVNFQVVTQAVQPVKQCPKTPQNVPASPVGDRSARHRYAQILPKPPSTSAITLRSPPALLITNSPIKTVMPTTQVSSVNVVKMTTISLGHSNSNTATISTTRSTPRPASAGVASLTDDLQPVTRVRSGSLAAMPSMLARRGRLATVTTPVTDIRLGSDTVPGSGQAQGCATGRLATPQEAAEGVEGVDGSSKPRAASVPTPLKISTGLDMGTGTKCNGRMLPRENSLAAGSNINNNGKERASYQGVPVQAMSLSSTPTVSSSAFVSSTRDAELTSKSPRKRQGLCPDSSHLTPVKKVFLTDEGTHSTTSGMGTTVQNMLRSDAPIRPVSAPASAVGKVLVKLNSNVPTRILAHSDSPVGNTGFQTISRPRSISHGHWEGPSSCVKSIAATSTAASTAPAPLFGNTSFQAFGRPRSVSQGRWEGPASIIDSKSLVTHTASATGPALLQQHATKDPPVMRMSSEQANSAACELEKSVFWDSRQQQNGTQQVYSQQGSLESKQISTPVMEPHQVMAQHSAPSQLVQVTNDMAEYVSTQPNVGYFPFNDDDMTQDSIVEELVQMEEQMKMNSGMQDFGGCVDMALQGQQATLQQNNMISNHQPNTTYYRSAHSRSTPIQTPTPTPTPTAEMMGGGQGLTRESPCSRLAPTTPVDSALGSSCQTPISTPHSNCSSSVPPSPVECRNPFAFTPINSSITSYHDGSIVSSSPVKPMQRPMATHPDKSKLEWINNGYNSGSGNSSNGISILPSYQDLVDDQFRKPHAFAIPGQTYQSQIRHHDTHVSRLTPMSPVQQQVASMANLNKQEGFAVPAPLDNKTSNSSSGSVTFRCRSVSPAVRQRNLSGSQNPNVPRSVVSPFNSPVTPEVLNIFANSQADTSITSMAQRSQSVPLNVMMQTEVLPMQACGQPSNTKKITNVLLSKMDGDGDSLVRGLGMNNMPSYTARMNLTQILETSAAPSFPSGANHQAQISPGPSAYRFQKPAYLTKNARGDQMSLSTGDGQGHAQSLTGEKQQQQHHQQQLSVEEQQNQAMLVRQQQNLQQHQHQQPLHFDSTVKDLLEANSLNAGSQLSGQVSELSAGSSEFPGDMRLASELSSSINDLNTLDTNLLFNPSQQQGQYEESTLEELKNDPLFQQICSETVNSAGFDWLENKDQATVEMLG
ncbi:DNA-binding protein RFX7 [Astyanax mexicanus]|uniref:DNA-binding protein RFX7 n=1 Tax=Astyanax mexicanus TaxID=7994 RepID=UPI0020CB4FE1|nr:DNA-binding protein RFX7 [Astyanax mexicanus]